MDHGTMTMTGTMTGSPTTMSMPTSTAGGGHSMGGMGNGCKISMLFNLNTIDSCFLSAQWHITSNAMFAGSCLGVFLLGIALEFLRRSIKEYDRFLIRQHMSKINRVATPVIDESINKKTGAVETAAAKCVTVPSFRPNVWQQGIRAFLHLLAFVVAYILMLLAMYYNGYLLICIFLGSFVGAFIFQWETLAVTGQQTSAASEGTVCCG